MKGKDKIKEGSKQATLFGMLPKADKIAKPKKKIDTEILPDANEETQVDSQMTDVSMAESGSVETQETQPSGDWDDITQELVISSDVISSEA